MKIKAGTLIRVKTEKELLKTGLKKERDGNLYDPYVGDEVISTMMNTLGKVYKVLEITDSNHDKTAFYIDLKNDIAYFTYYFRWVEVLDTKAAKILFRQ